MTRHVTLKEFADQLPELMKRAGQGDEIVIDEGGKTMARVVPETKVLQPREPGGAEGLIKMADDFNAPLSDDVTQDFSR